jgi:uncharacterized protein (TIGR02757 family)
MAQSLKQILDKLYRDYDFKGRIAHDPIEFPHRYKRPEDIETAGFIAACFAYGRVDLFKPVVAKVLAAMGESPYDFLLRFNAGKQKGLFSGISYRFNKSTDIAGLLHVLGTILRKYGGLETVFLKYYTEGDATTCEGLTGLVETILSIDTTPVYGENIRPAGFVQFFPSPAGGSACKRMNMYLRWMVRDRDIDFGIWKNIPKDRLVIPLDVHIARISKCLGFTKRSSQDWKMAVEITAALKQLDPEDPLKYDFALCHQGISKACSAAQCGDCTLFSRRLN